MTVTVMIFVAFIYKPLCLFSGYFNAASCLFFFRKHLSVISFLPLKLHVVFMVYVLHVFVSSLCLFHVYIHHTADCNITVTNMSDEEFMNISEHPPVSSPRQVSSLQRQVAL